MGHSGRVRTRWLAVAALVAALSVALVLGWTPLQRYTGTLDPPQFTGRVSPTVPPGSRVLGIAHNAGNSAGTTSAALRHGADVVEIDVTRVGGRLVAARHTSWGWLRPLVFFGPALADAWGRIPATEGVLLDLQHQDDDLLAELVTFLGPRLGSRRVLISSPSLPALQELCHRLPGVSVLLTLAWPADVSHLQSHPALREAIDGVSVFRGLVTRRLIAWLHEKPLLVVAWTINDAGEASLLVQQGIDGITTDNLTILQALASAHGR